MADTTKMTTERFYEMSDEDQKSFIAERTERERLAALAVGSSVVTGDYVLLRYGHGTQLVVVVAETAKRLTIRRCEGWKTDPEWKKNVSKISRDDTRLMEKLNGIPAGIPAPPS